MAEHGYKITIKGPGLSFDQPVDKSAANRIISFVMMGAAVSNGNEGLDGTQANQNAPKSNLSSGAAA